MSRNSARIHSANNINLQNSPLKPNDSITSFKSELINNSKLYNVELIEVLILTQIFVIQVTTDVTIGEIGIKAYQSYVKAQPRDVPRRILYIKDSDGRILTDELQPFQLFGFNKSKYECIVETYSIEDIITPDEMETSYRHWQLWYSQQICAYIENISVSYNIEAFDTPNTHTNSYNSHINNNININNHNIKSYEGKLDEKIFILLNEFIYVNNSSIQLSILKSFYLLNCRFNSLKIINYSINCIIKLFHNTIYSTIIIEILISLSSIIMRGIKGYNESMIQQNIFNLINIEIILLKFPKQQSIIFQKYEIMISTIKLSDRMAAIEHFRPILENTNIINENENENNDLICNKSNNLILNNKSLFIMNENDKNNISTFNQTQDEVCLSVCPLASMAVY